jgi:hypothetical protein
MTLANVISLLLHLTHVMAKLGSCISTYKLQNSPPPFSLLRYCHNSYLVQCWGLLGTRCNFIVNRVVKLGEEKGQEVLISFFQQMCPVK